MICLNPAELMSTVQTPFTEVVVPYHSLIVPAGIMPAELKAILLGCLAALTILDKYLSRLDLSSVSVISLMVVLGKYLS